MVPFLISIARKSAWILLAAMTVALFSGLLLVKYPLFPGFSYGLIREIHVFFVLIVLIPVFYLHTLGGIVTLLKRNGLENKKILAASVITGWTAVILVFGFVYLSAAPAPVIAGAMNDTGRSRVTLTPEEIAKHGSAGSCWVIISGRVYDLTSYIGIHPGGPGRIIPSCGKDGTTAFATKNSGSSHSTYAASLLDLYYIGDLRSAATVTQGPAGTTPPVPREEFILPATTGPAGSRVTLTPEEIAKHGSAGSCWVIISGRVYDLTSYIGIHPGGAGRIIPSCGKDGTTAFATKNSGSSHSSFAVSLLDTYYIGDSGASVILTPRPAGTTIPPRSNGEEEEEEDD